MSDTELNYLQQLPRMVSEMMREIIDKPEGIIGVHIIIHSEEGVSHNVCTTEAGINNSEIIAGLEATKFDVLMHSRKFDWADDE